MTPPNPEIDAIVAGLTEARKAMVLALPGDGGWGAVPSRSVAKRVWWNFTPSLLKHKHRPKDANEWALTPLGLAVRARLQQKDPEQ